MEEKAELQALQAEYRKLGKLFDALGQVKPDSPESLDQLENRLNALPPGEMLGRAVDELRQRTQAFLDRFRQHRSEAFRRIEADFIREVRAREEFARELNSGWRLGPLEIQVRRDQSRVCFLYNYEAVIDWSPVGNRADLDTLQAKAVAMLERAALPEEQLVAVFISPWQTAPPTPPLARNRPGRSDRPGHSDRWRGQGPRREQGPRDLSHLAAT